MYWDVHPIFWSSLFKPLQLVGGKDDEATQAKLYLVDLAGSERVKDSAATGGPGDAGDVGDAGDAGDVGGG